MFYSIKVWLSNEYLHFVLFSKKAWRDWQAKRQNKDLPTCSVVTGRTKSIWNKMFLKQT